MKATSKKLKIKKVSIVDSDIHLQCNTVRVRLNVSYRHGIAQNIKTICIHKDVIEMDFMFFESLNKNHYVYHDKKFIMSHLYHAEFPKKMCVNQPEKEVQFNQNQIEKYLETVDPDAVNSFHIDYGKASINLEGVLYTLPNVISIIIDDPTGRMQKINALKAILEA